MAWRDRGPEAATHSKTIQSGDALRPANRGLGAVDVSPGAIPLKIIRGVPMARGVQQAAIANGYNHVAKAMQAELDARTAAAAKPGSGKK